MIGKRYVLAACALALFAVGGPGALAIGPNEQCASVTANKAFTDGRPHLWQSSTVYGTTSCTNAYVVDVTYSALSPLPGTYLSWGDDEPVSESACRQSALRMYVWDLSGAQPSYKGTATTEGTWIDNDDLVHNPGATKVCHVPPLRAEAAFQLASGRKYRFALRAEREGQNQGLVFANAPVPSRKGNNAAGTAEGLFLAIPATAPERDETNWPVSPFAVKLESPDRRVARGGDLMFDGSSFFKFAGGYASGNSPNFGLSNAMLLYQGNVGGLTDISCPAYTLTATERSYTYSPGWEPLPTFAGSRYCLLNERNDKIYKLKVWKSDPSYTLILVGYLPSAQTGRRTWGCMDGFCDHEVRIATQYAQATEAERVDFVSTVFGFLRSTRTCLDTYLKRSLPVPLPISIHAERASTPTSLTHNYGTGGPQVTTTGFEGLIRPGQTRVTDPLDLRYELHEPMHVYNYYFFEDSLPSWLDEDFAIQAEGRVGCGGDPRLMMMGWRTWKPGDTDGHPVGSEFFKRLEAEHGCTADCVAEAWRDLVDAHGDDRYLTNAEIKAVFERRLDTDLSPIFTTIGVNYQRSFFLPSTARIAGQGGSFYTTDVTVANGTDSDASVTLEFLGHDADGLAGAERTVTVGAGQAVTFDDVLSKQFGIASGYGAIRVTSSAPLTVLGQTSTPGPTGGTFGQSVPAISDDELIDRSGPRSIAAVREDAGFRTNLLLANAYPTSLVVNVSLLDANGLELAHKSYTLPPLGMTQVTQVVRDLGVTANVQNAVLLVTTARQDAAFAAYASVIDKKTNDPRTLLPASTGTGGGTWIVPSSARTQGQGGAFYTTRLTLANRSETDASVTLEFLGHDTDGRGGAQKVVTLVAGRSVTYDDVLGGAFGLSSGYGAIRISSPTASLNILAETSTPGPGGGTFGQSVPASSEADLLKSGTARSIAAVREDGRFRTNLILTNATGATLVVEAKLFSGAGVQLAVGSHTLPPLGMRQVTQVVRDLGVAADVQNGQLLLSTATPGGSFAAYATVIDRTTNDPRTLLPR
jgi:extradiol dioxygenase family protein